MIVRISGEGQFRLSDDAIDRINELDNALEAALETAEYEAALAALLDEVRSLGEAVADDDLVESDVVLPPSDATAAEVKAMLAEDGLIPG